MHKIVKCGVAAFWGSFLGSMSLRTGCQNRGHTSSDYITESACDVISCPSITSLRAANVQSLLVFRTFKKSVSEYT